MIQLLNNKIMNELYTLIVRTKALEMWFHSAHFCVKGTPFVGDHELLYADIYEQLSSLFDSFTERAIGLSQNEIMACPLKVSSDMAKYMSSLETPCKKSAEEIAKMSYDLMMDYIRLFDWVYNSIKNSGRMTLGLDDLIMASANQIESFLYLLGQRKK